MTISCTNKPRNIYLSVILIWALLLSLVVYTILEFDLQRAEREFIDDVNIHYQQVNTRTQINESILEGFAAMISTTQDFDRASIVNYAQLMLKQYPHIFMFEIAEKVPDDQLKTFSEYYRKKISPEFKVKAFSYETNRQWQPIAKAKYHMPIVFMEPLPPASKQVLGLDLSSNHFFKRALDKSERLKRSIASDPFKLIEGDLAYLIHKPILAAEQGNQAYINKSGAQGGFAILVIRADSLLASENHVFPGITELLYNPAYDYTDNRGHLYRNNATEISEFESKLFPHLLFRKTITSESQPFVLRIEQQLGWNIVSWGKIASALLAALATFAILIIYARLNYQNKIERIATSERLFYRANHDALTGLANRSLFYDRLNHALSQAARQKEMLAVLFLDLKSFKAVNDNFGHSVGDEVIKLAAERLQDCVRSADTVARQGGDEFILVQEKISGQQDVDYIVKKIKTKFEQPFTVNYHLISVGINIGSALYPINGEDVESLVNHADSSMYTDKRAGK